MGPSRGEEAGRHVPMEDAKGKEENGRRKTLKREVKVAPPTRSPKADTRCDLWNEAREVVSACSDRPTDRNMVDKF